MVKQMKMFFEIKNSFKEMLKGTPIENFAKSTYDLLIPSSYEMDLNKQDNALMSQILQRILNQESNCIDIGCNTGDVLAHIVQLSPSGYHYAFEPLPRLATRLKNKFPHVDIRQVALSNSEGETSFWYVVNAPALSSLKKDIWKRHIRDAITENITVKTQRLDDILNPELKIDLVKVDVEGVELEVLKGAIRTLKTHRPYVFFEHGELVDGKPVHDRRIYDLLVNECNLHIFELRSWLQGLSPLSLDEYLHTGVWNFFAAP
ncbi:FkbM family methyltransferase [Iningainema sp. BLCCT55]|uniref:FkbM family methyltransferase n=2 Tax=Iningainema TaxID=1932705 RepID=A0A8J6XFR3_9CYAN|nr:FkbM family methyltransferase [Iningainema tapete BLCC-T55]